MKKKNKLPDWHRVPFIDENGVGIPYREWIKLIHKAEYEDGDITLGEYFIKML